MAPKLTLKDLYGERGAARFTARKGVPPARAINGQTTPGVPTAGAPPRAVPFRPVPGQAENWQAAGAMGFVGLNGTDRGVLDQKLSELDSAFRKTLIRYIGGSGLFPGDQVIQDLLGNSSIANALKMTYRTLSLLGGDLYQAAIGQHVFPLDNGSGPNEQAALAVWNNLAADVQQTLTGVLGYMAKWGPLPGLSTLAQKAGDVITNPLKWPWYVQLAAAGAVMFYGSKLLSPVLGASANARRAFADVPRLPGYHKKRKKR